MRTYSQDAALPISASGNNTVSLGDLLSLHGAAPVFFQITGTFSASYVAEVSVDGATWVDASQVLYDVSTGNVMTSPITAPVILFANAPLPRMRFRCSAFTSASTTVPPRVHVMGQDSRSV